MRLLLRSAVAMSLSSPSKRVRQGGRCFVRCRWDFPANCSELVIGYAGSLIEKR